MANVDCAGGIHNAAWRTLAVPPPPGGTLDALCGAEHAASANAARAKTDVRAERCVTMKSPFRLRSTPLLLLVPVIAGCSNQAPYVTTVGLLSPGATMAVRAAGGTVSAFAPAAGDPRNRFTISATAPKGQTQSAPPKLRAGRDGLT